MSNVLNEEQKQQVIALGRLGWSLRRIERETGVRRETISSYLKDAGIAVRPPRGRHVRAAASAAKPASEPEVSPDFGAESEAETAAQTPPQPGRSPTASACEVHHELIELWLSRGRNAKAIWQDLVDDYGFTGRYQSVKRFVRKLRGKPATEACAVIETAPGEDYGKFRVMVRNGGDSSLLTENLRRAPVVSLHNAPTEPQAT